MKKNPKLLLWIIALIMVTGGLYLIISTFTPPGYQKAIGTVMTDSSSSGYQRNIQFKAHDGRIYTASDRSYSNAQRTSDEVTVAYDPASPEETMKVVSDSGRSMVWGGVVVLLGAGFVYLGFRRSKHP